MMSQARQIAPHSHDQDCYWCKRLSRPRRRPAPPHFEVVIELCESSKNHLGLEKFGAWWWEIDLWLVDGQSRMSSLWQNSVLLKHLESSLVWIVPRID